MADGIGERCEGEETGRLLADLLECKMNYLHVDSSEGSSRSSCLPFFAGYDGSHG